MVGLCSAQPVIRTSEHTEIHKSFLIPLSSKANSPRQLSAAHRFLWHNWQRKQRVVVDVTFWGMDFGAVHTVYLKPDDKGRWTITEYSRHYQLPEREPEAAKLVATGINLRPRRLRNGMFVVRLVAQNGTTHSLFQ